MSGCVTRTRALRGTTAQRLLYTPLEGEFVWDTTLNEMYVGDGSTLGGLPLSNITDEQIQDLIGALIGDSSTIDVTYDDAGNVLTMDVITSALNHDDLIGSGTNTHAQIDSHIADTANPHVVTITQAISADGGTDITVVELELLTDGSDASTLHNHDTRYFTKVEITTQNDAQDADITQNSDDIAAETSARITADASLQSDIDDVESDLAQEVIDRTNVDTTLQANIDTLETEIDQEVIDRTSEDTVLQNQINTINTTIADFETSTELDARDVANRDRSNHTGAQLSSTISDLTARIQTDETTTSLTMVGNILRYTDEDGTITDHDLTIYLDDTNAARIVSGVLSAGIITFTRDDATTFTIDASDLLDNQNASEVPVTPIGGLTSTDVQAALEEHQSDIEGLQTQITSNDADITILQAGQTTQDMGISNNASSIATETTNRVDADALLQSQIDNNDTDIAAIQAEQTTQNTDIMDNTLDIATEITNRTAADTALQSQIDMNDTDISNLQTEQTTQNSNISALEAEQLVQNSNISSNTSDITDIETAISNVDNTSDLDKPISTATQTALDLKYDASNPSGFETPAELDSRDTVNRDRANHTGTQLASTISDLSTAIAAAETNTVLSFNTTTNILSYVSEDGTTANIDLSLFLDDTNLAQITSGVLNPTTGIVTFTRDDSSTFTVDFSSLNDQGAIVAAISAHEAEVNPHSQYQTSIETQSQIDTVQSQIDSNNTDIADNVAAIQINIDNINSLDSDLDTETLNRISNDNLLQAGINTNTTDITSLNTSQAAQDLSISSNTTAIANETVDRLDADTALQTDIDTKYDASNPDGFINEAESIAAAPVQSVNGETGSITNVAKTDESNDFTENQRISDEVNPLLILGDNNNRLAIGYNEAVNYTPGRTGIASAEVITDRAGDIHYSTRPSASNFGHRFYTSISGVLTECFRMSIAGINGFMKQAKNFADPTDPQDLATKNYVLDRVLVSTTTNNTTNINTAVYTNAPVFGTNRFVNDNGSFTPTSANTITINFTGEIVVSVNVAMTSVGQRATLEGSIAINGVQVGPEANTGYIRAVSGHNEASHHLSDVYLQVTTGDVLSYQMRRESTLTTAVTLIANKGQVSIKKINT